MVTLFKPQYLEGPCYNSSYFHTRRDLSKNHRNTWNGWTVGSYVYFWHPVTVVEVSSCDIQSWQNYPVLLVDIIEDVTGHVRFVVAHLYDRDIAVRHFRRLTKFAQCKTSISWLVSLKNWPQHFTYVLTDHFELAYEWELRTWTRSVPPSLTTRWVFSTRNSKLSRCEILLDTGIGNVLDTASGFRPFLRLPLEIRDRIYGYALWDERQKRIRSLIYTHSLLCKRYCQGMGWPWYRDFSMPTLGPLPMLQTPGILRVCKQIRREALDALHWIKIFVITVACVDSFNGLDKDWLPNMSYFARIRVDLILPDLEPTAVRECFRAIINILQARALSLQWLEIRIGYSHWNTITAVQNNRFIADGSTSTAVFNSSTTVRNSSPAVCTNLSAVRSDSATDNHRKARMISYEDVAGNMRELAILSQHKHCGTEHEPLQISWGVSDTHKKAGDYSCACTYLRASFLQNMWNHRNHDPKSDHDNMLDPSVAGEDCRHMGCKIHSCSML
jgi:hypothetical protein